MAFATGKATEKEATGLAADQRRLMELVKVPFESLITSAEREEYLRRALEAYSEARRCFRRAGDSRSLAVVEHRLARLNLRIKNFKEAHGHLRQARRLFEELGDEGATAEVDGTRSRVFAAQGNYVWAARLAHEVAEVLEQIGGHSGELIQALITRGQALARRGKTELAISSLRRAHVTSISAGDNEGAGLANLALVEELHSSMTPEELLECYSAADRLLKSSQDPDTLARLRGCAKIVIQNSREAYRSTHIQEASLLAIENHFELTAEVNRFEGMLIRRAMELSDNKLRPAARLLGLKSHHTLLAMLNARHKGLIPGYKPTRGARSQRK